MPESFIKLSGMYKMDAIGLEYNAASNGSASLVYTCDVRASSTYVNSLVQEIANRWSDFYTQCIRSIYLIYIKSMSLSINENRNASCNASLFYSNYLSETLMSASRSNNILSINDPYNVQTNGFWLLPGFDVYVNVYNSYTSFSSTCEVYVVTF